MSRVKLILIGVGVGLGLIAAFVGGRHCGSGGNVIVDQEIDGGAADDQFRSKVDAATQKAEQRIQEIEQQYEEDLSQFDDQQQREYQQVREEGPEAVAKWLSDFNRQLRGEQ